MNVYLIIGIITIITGFLYSTFVSCWTHANKEIGLCLGDGNGIQFGSNPVQSVITSKELSNLQGIFGFAPLIARIVPFLFFYISGIDFLTCIVAYFIFWLIITSPIRVFITYKVKLLTILKVNYNDIINRYADYKRDGDVLRAEAIEIYIELMERLIDFFEFLKENNLDVCIAHTHYWINFISNCPNNNFIEIYKKCFDPNHTMINHDLSLIGELGIITDLRNFLNNFTNILNYNPHFIEKYIDNSVDSMVSYRKILYDVELNKLLKLNDKESFEKLYNQMVKEFGIDKGSTSKNSSSKDEEIRLNERAEEIVRKIGFNDWTDFEKNIRKEKNLRKRKFVNNKEKYDYIVKSLGYNDFYDFYDLNISGDDND